MKCGALDIIESINSSGRKNVLTVSGNSSTSSVNYTVISVDNIIFEGTDAVGTPKEITFVCFTNNGINGGSVKIIDKTNGDNLICEINDIISTDIVNLAITNVLANLPTGKALLQVQHKAGIGETFRTRGVSIL